MAVTVIVSAEIEAGVGGSSTRHIREPMLLLLATTVPVYALPRKCTVTVVPGFRPQPNRAARAGALCSTVLLLIVGWRLIASTGSGGGDGGGGGAGAVALV